MYSINKKSIALLCSFTGILIGCGADSGPQAPTPGVGGSYLHVSVPDFYFGTREVGTKASQTINITNRGADAYPIKTVRVTGDNADEFTTDFYSEIVLNPAEAIDLNIDFAPVTDGRKYAALDIDFETIVMAPEEKSRHEQTYYRARDLENAGEYGQSLVAYDDYMQGEPATKNKVQAAIKAPVLKEAALYGDGDDFNLYLNAMNARESEDYDRAFAELDAIEILHSDSYIADDAAYLRAYINLMDIQDYRAAEKSMRKLRTDYPDSNYYDTALYSEGVAHRKMGNRQIARNIFKDLKHRHTGVDVLGVQLAKDNLISRMWFDRAFLIACKTKIAPKNKPLSRT